MTEEEAIKDPDIFYELGALTVHFLSKRRSILSLQSRFKSKCQFMNSNPANVAKSYCQRDKDNGCAEH